MAFVKAKPNEYLIVGRAGKVVNRGVAASEFLWPGLTYVLIPSTQQEAAFEMTQESKDGIPLRFKGIVIYRITHPEVAARLFDFTGGSGPDEIKAQIGHICLGELRALVSHMTMQECIEQRKTTLTDATVFALRQTVQGEPGQFGWGIEIGVAQVSQVFIVDNELRRQLEAEVRNQIKSRSELSEIRLREEIKLAQVISEQRLQHEGLESEKGRIAIAREKLQLQKTLEREEAEAQQQLKAEAELTKVRLAQEIRLAQTASDQQIERETAEAEKGRLTLAHQKWQLQQELEREQAETGAPIQLLKLAKQIEVLRSEQEKQQLERDIRAVEVQKEMLLEEAQHVLRKELLPLEQMPQVAEAVAKTFQGANLSIYGEASPLFSALGPLVELLAKTLRGQDNKR